MAAVSMCRQKPIGGNQVFVIVQSEFVTRLFLPDVAQDNPTTLPTGIISPPINSLPLEISTISAPFSRLGTSQPLEVALEKLPTTPFIQSIWLQIRL